MNMFNTGASPRPIPTPCTQHPAGQSLSPALPKALAAAANDSSAVAAALRAGGLNDTPESLADEEEIEPDGEKQGRHRFLKRRRRASAKHPNKFSDFSDSAKHPNKFNTISDSNLYQESLIYLDLELDRFEEELDPTSAWSPSRGISVWCDNHAQLAHLFSAWEKRVADARIKRAKHRAKILPFRLDS